MSQSNISVYPGTDSRRPFIEIHITTGSPIHWLTYSRQVLAYLLEGFNERAMPDGATVRAFGVRLLSWLFPLPAQMLVFPGLSMPTTAPAADENGGWYLTENGLALRFIEGDTFEELEQIHRALIALACFNGYEMSDNARADFFALADALRPNGAALSMLILGKGLPTGYRLDKGETESIEAVASSLEPCTNRLRRVLATASDRQNARYLAGLVRLQQEGAVSEANFNRLLEWVAVGMDAADDDATK